MPLAPYPGRRRARLVRVSLLALLLVFVPGGTSASERVLTPDFLLRNWDLDDGLPSTRISGVARALDGYLWLATQWGLVRFDGLRFVTFNQQNTPALRENRVRCLAVAPDGTLWAGTETGTLVRGDQRGFTAVELGGTTQGKRINGLALERHGALWLATEGAGLLRLANGGTAVFGRTNGLPSLSVAQVLLDCQERLWVVAGGALTRFEGGNCRAPDGGPPLSLPVCAIASGRDGGLWVALVAQPGKDAGTTIFKLKDGQWTAEPEPYPWPQDSPRSRATALLEDQAGRVWCATAGGGVFFRPPGAPWQSLGSEVPLSHLETLCLEQDEGGVVWIGTRTAGLHEVRPRPVTARYLPASARQHALVTVCITHDASVWGGTDGAGVFRWRGIESTRYGWEEGLTNLQVAALFEDSRTNLWAGSLGGLFRLQDDRFEPVAGPPAFRQPILALFEDRQQQLWIGSRGGLVCLGEGRTRVFGPSDGLPGNDICALAQDREGRLWVAVKSAGLFRQTGERFEPYAPKTWGNGTDIHSWKDDGQQARALLCNADGTIWLATQGADLYRLRNERADVWRWRKDGLPSGHHFGMLEDRQGNLWLSSENGIFGLSKELLDRYRRGQSPRLTPWRLTPADGLAYKVCSGLGQPSAAQSPDGRLWFADGPALADFDPAAITLRDSRVWRPILEEVVVDGTPLTPDNTGRLRVKSGARRFEFHYTAPDIFASERLRFLVRLVGLDRGWVDAGSLRVAYYSRLAPGDYEFQVRVSSAGEVWQEAGRSLRLQVVPRFYERRSAQLAGALALLGVMGGTVWRVERARSRRRLERLQLQRAMDHERQRIARDIHDDLGSGLTEIILVSDSLRQDGPAAPALQKMVGEIATRARALTRAMDEVVWAVNPRNDTLENFLAYLNEFAQEYLTLAGLRCRWDVPLDLPELPLSAETRHHLYLGCKEALNNIVKHAAASEARLRLELRPDSFTLIVEDNGRGFVPAAPSARGNGLANMRRRLEELGGKCEVDSAPGAGTRVRFSLPAPRAGFQPRSQPAHD